MIKLFSRAVCLAAAALPSKVSVLIVFITSSLFLSCRNLEDNHNNRLVLQFPLENRVSSFDPAQFNNVSSGLVLGHLYESLYQYHYLKRPFSLTTSLAAQMPRVQDQGKTYIIKIKKNIAYHPHPCLKRKYVEAKDFATQLKRLIFLGQRKRIWWPLGNNIKGTHEFIESFSQGKTPYWQYPVKGIETPDSSTLIIRLNSQDQQFIYQLAMVHTAPIPEEVLACPQFDFTRNEIGTGPFYLNSNSKIKLTKNLPPPSPSPILTQGTRASSPARLLDSLLIEKFEGYREDFYPNYGDVLAFERGLLNDQGKKIPFTQGINFNYVFDEEQMLKLFRERKLDLIIVRGHMANMKAPLFPREVPVGPAPVPPIKESVVASSGILWLNFNMRHPVLGSNLKLRKAIAHALNLENYIQLHTNGIVEKANSFFPPGILGHNPSDTFDYDFDPLKAQQFLQEAQHFQKKSARLFPVDLSQSVSSKSRPPLVLHFDIKNYDQTGHSMATFLQNSLRPLNIDLRIRTHSPEEYIEWAQKGRLEIWVRGWLFDYPDPENILRFLTTENIGRGINDNQFSHPHYDQLYRQLKEEMNPELKLKVVNEMQKIIEEQLPWIPLYYLRNYIYTWPSISNYRYSDFHYNWGKYIKITP